MTFVKSINNDFKQEEYYELLEYQMSKYQTLNHESIEWDKVYEYSLNLLKTKTIDIKICNYFSLACLYLNNATVYENLLKLFKHLNSLLNSNTLTQDEKILNSYKKRLEGIIKNFINQFNNAKLNINPDMALEFNEIFKELEKSLNISFIELNIQKAKIQDNQHNKEKINLNNEETKKESIDLLNDRSYKTYFNDLAFKLLTNDIDNLTAYALFIEACWGKIEHLPPHENFITFIESPNKNLEELLLKESSNLLEHIKLFMSHLALNPFWFEGFKMFCEFLKKHKKYNIAKFLCSLIYNFIDRFKELLKLKFSNNTPFCEQSLLNYFSNKNENTKANPSKIQKDLNQSLIDIDKNRDNSLFSTLNSLIQMAELFEEQKMEYNAKIIYTQIKDLMEKKLLKDYLTKEYEKAKLKAFN
ncbi:type VI secretion system domain-containing protein [Campylobacter novaezeelandiae]|uniref:type VI secretion system domain-containing protein n=1 Tax=Campylobacter novaezeelandiae TaxID=2267891 RepID=UPI00190854AD|nr:type VI secretion system domain-containing protein [Campylobacter novaezeelandiae]MBK1964705.1 type VI secretion system domain-containing protein [Campylobacter novaezeelandiae]MBK1993018.1 type VI secretion system domain-containing protein [Campylobacter novaezeelandiae]